MERVLLNSVNFVHSVKTLILLAKAQRMIKATLLRQNLQNEQNGIAPSISWRGACPLRNGRGACPLRNERLLKRWTRSKKEALIAGKTFDNTRRVGCWSEY